MIRHKEIYDLTASWFTETWGGQVELFWGDRCENMLEFIIYASTNCSSENHTYEA